MFRLAAKTSAREWARGMVLGALLWSLFVGAVCVVILRGAVRQVISAGWPTADGKVTVSEVTGSKKNSWKVEYVYSVAGQPYAGERFAYDPMPVQGREEVERHVAAYPAGAAVTVYYDPGNPGEAVLYPGLRGCTLWVALFLTPFVMIGLGLSLAAIRPSVWRGGFDPGDSRQITETESGTIVVRPELKSWQAIFLTDLGFAAFAASWFIFFVGFAIGVGYRLFDGFLLDPPLTAPLAVWTAIIIGCALATWWEVRRTRVLTVDHLSRQVGFGPADSADFMPFTTIAEVTVKQQVEQSGNTSTTRHRVEIARNDGGNAVAIAEYADPRDAEALADWLRGAIQSPATINSK